jgi:hypothetical protein
MVDTSSGRLHSLESILQPSGTTQRNGALREHLCYVSIEHAQGPILDSLEVCFFDIGHGDNENTSEVLGGHIVNSSGHVS